MSSKKVDKKQKTKMSQEAVDDSAKKKQAKLNPANPMTGIVNEILSSSSESSEEDDNIDEVREVTSIGSMDVSFRQLLLSKLKNKKLIMGCNFLEVMNYSRKQDKLNPLKLPKKTLDKLRGQKNVLSKLVLAGIKCKPLDRFLNTKSEHLGIIADYLDISAKVCSNIFDILKNDCQVVEIDVGILTDYFNERFADVRNQNNYAAVRLAKRKESSEGQKGPGKEPTKRKEPEMMETLAAEAPPKMSKKASKAPR